jgi:hypothetical protein
MKLSTRSLAGRPFRWRARLNVVRPRSSALPGHAPSIHYAASRPSQPEPRSASNEALVWFDEEETVPIDMCALSAVLSRLAYETEVTRAYQPPRELLELARGEGGRSKRPLRDRFRITRACGATCTALRLRLGSVVRRSRSGVVLLMLASSVVALRWILG